VVCLHLHPRGGAYFRASTGLPAIANNNRHARPILGFFFLYATQERFRRYVLSLDLRFLTIVHACRTVGFAFVLLHMRDALPGLFAWPAGLRDIAVAITAPGILFALLKSPDVAKSNRFICGMSWGWLILSPRSAQVSCHRALSPLSINRP